MGNKMHKPDMVDQNLDYDKHFVNYSLHNTEMFVQCECL